MTYSTEQKRKELEKYFEEKSSFNILRVAQMKRDWKKANRRELTWWESTYIPTVAGGIWTTSTHFFRNLFFCHFANFG